jgi:hypothetical protein
MKRIIFLVLFGAILATGSQAQFSFGAKGGLTIADMDLDVEPDTAIDFILGGHAGVFFKIGDGLFSFQPEVMYVRRGARKVVEGSEYYRQVNMNYIDVPLLARLSFNLKVAELYFNFGPYVGYMMSAKINDKTFDEEQNAWVESDYKYDFDEEFVGRWDVGAVMGAGVRVLMIIVEVRYNHGFINIANKDILRYDNSNNKFLNVSLGVQF